MNSKHKRLLAGILACLMLCMFAAPARVWADEAEDTSAAEQTVEENTSEQEETAETLPEETIHIASAEELLNFAESCTLDTWSQNKRVVLDCDISLEGVDFEPIPSFGGTFVGGGHTIRGLRDHPLLRCKRDGFRREHDRRRCGLQSRLYRLLPE